MSKKKRRINIVTRALEMRALAIAQAEELKTSKNPRSAGMALVFIGKAKGLEELLNEYGIDAEEESKPKIVLAS